MPMVLRETAVFGALSLAAGIAIEYALTRYTETLLYSAAGRFHPGTPARFAPTLSPRYAMNRRHRPASPQIPRRLPVPLDVLTGKPDKAGHPQRTIPARSTSRRRVGDDDEALRIADGQRS